MNVIETTLLQSISGAVSKLFGVTSNDIKIEPTREGFEGHFTWVAFPYLKISKKSPEETARLVGEYLQENVPEVATFNVVKGFLNLVVADTYWFSFLSAQYRNAKIGCAEHPSGKKIVLEYSSPNTNKPLHLGHVRNNLLGWSLAEILKANGHEVVKVNLINDRGIHICKSMVSWIRSGAHETPENSGIKGDKLVGKYYVMFDQAYRKEVQALVEGGMEKENAEKNAGILLEAQELLRKWEAGDMETREIWKKMNSWVYAGFDKTYRRLGVDFDKFYYESDTYLLGKKLVEEGLSQGHFTQRNDGSVWIDLTSDGLDEKLLLRADGTSVYITQDLGTAQLKYEDYTYDQSVYVVGNEQDYHFQVLKLILNKMGKPYGSGIFHLSYGMVDLPSGKMKSREGTVVDADDLMDEVQAEAEKATQELGKTAELAVEDLSALYHSLGMGALKYFLLRVDPVKRMMFNPQESIDLHGNTGPFIQYTHARICSILRNVNYQWGYFEPAKVEGPERQLMVALHSFPDTIRMAGDLMNPALVAHQLYETARLFNRFYHECPILKEPNEDIRSFRLALTVCAGSVIKNGLHLLGIDAVERM